MEKNNRKKSGNCQDVDSIVNYYVLLRSLRERFGVEDKKDNKGNRHNG